MYYYWTPAARSEKSFACHKKTRKFNYLSVMSGCRYGCILSDLEWYVAHLTNKLQTKPKLS